MSALDRIHHNFLYFNEFINWDIDVGYSLRWAELSMKCPQTWPEPGPKSPTWEMICVRSYFF